MDPAKMATLNGIWRPLQPLNAGAANPKLVSAAHSFEASLMKEFLKPLEHDTLFSGSGSGSAASGDAGEGSAGALMSFGSESMAKAISEHGGFGIATRILNHFRQASQSGQPVLDSDKALRPGSK